MDGQRTTHDDEVIFSAQLLGHNKNDRVNACATLQEQMSLWKVKDPDEIPRDRRGI